MYCTLPGKWGPCLVISQRVHHAPQPTTSPHRNDVNISGHPFESVQNRLIWYYIAKCSCFSLANEHHSAIFLKSRNFSAKRSVHFAGGRSWSWAPRIRQQLGLIFWDAVVDLANDRTFHVSDRFWQYLMLSSSVNLMLSCFFCWEHSWNNTLQSSLPSAGYPHGCPQRLLMAQIEDSPEDLGVISDRIEFESGDDDSWDIFPQRDGFFCAQNLTSSVRKGSILSQTWMICLVS